MGIFNKLFRSANEKQIDNLKKIVDKVNGIESQYTSMTDAELREQTVAFKARLEQGELLDDIMVEAYAVVREAAKRVLNMRHFDVQIMGGVVLHQGRIAQMSTGEGKTLVATLPAYLNALAGLGVHIVTVNDYLAKRDAEWMGKVYKFLGLTVGVVVPGMSHKDKQAAYNCDILYATNNELGFDYLRDNMATSQANLLQRKLYFAIIDEVDSILIDEARTPLIISGGNRKSSDMYVTANRFSKTVGDDDYIIEEKERTIRLTEDGVSRAEKFFNVDNLSDIENEETMHYINNALKARFLMLRDKDYIVKDGQVVIVDEFTGRIMVGRRYSDGLHQAIEAKENVQIQGENKTLATITFQNFFRIYTKVSGMTGTAKTEEEEFKNIYKLDVVVLPTNKPCGRVDERDKLYINQKGKMRAIVQDVQTAFSKGQPVLVGTASVDKSEEFAEEFKKAGIQYNILNAKNHENEAEIIAQAGRLSQVTIATNMAGRGTDILLGGNPEFMAKEKLKNLGYSPEIIAEATSFAALSDEVAIKAKDDYNHYYAIYKEKTDKEKDEVTALGGIRIVGTLRHESRRIDDQLRGRSGRQGDPGSSVFYLSLEDDLLRIFGGDTIKAIADKYNFDEDQAIELGIVTSQISKAQARNESRDFSVRKQVLQYDDVINYQRKIIYKERNRVLEGMDISEQIVKMIIDQAEAIIDQYSDYSIDYRDWDYDAFNAALEARVLLEGSNVVTEELASARVPMKIRDAVVDLAVAQFEEKVAQIKELGLDFDAIQRNVLLNTVDRLWIEHIDNMHQLRQGISLLAYGQKDPILAYRQQGTDMFNEMTEKIARETVTVLCKSTIEREVERKQVATESSNSANPKTETMVRKDKKVGRNDTCTCGSGKKYKNCCGREDN